MVRIVNYQKRETEEGKEFFLLELQGGIETIKSKESGRFYLTAKKTMISSTFDEQTCMALIGTELEGKIEKVECDPYEYTIKDTGEVIELSFRYQYIQQEEKVNVVQKSTTTVDEFMTSNPKGNAFSTNGHLVHQ